jgi:hypothetical protein
MKRLPAIVLAAGAALATPAFAATVTQYYWDAPSQSYVKQVTVYDEPQVYYTYPAPTYPAPTTVTYIEEPPVIVTAPRLTEDQAITEEVMDRIASDPRIDGRIGVDTYMDKVTLSGRVVTPWQADRAQMHAQNTPGVREVDNQIRARVGG